MSEQNINPALDVPVSPGAKRSDTATSAPLPTKGTLSVAMEELRRATKGAFNNIDIEEFLREVRGRDPVS